MKINKAFIRAMEKAARRRQCQIAEGACDYADGIEARIDPHDGLPCYSCCNVCRYGRNGTCENRCARKRAEEIKIDGGIEND